MSLSSLKDRIRRLPIVGGLSARLRGVWTLPVWRQAIRDDVAALQVQQQQVSAMLAEIQASQHDVVQRIARHDDALYRWLGAGGERLNRQAADLQRCQRQLAWLTENLSYSALQAGPRPAPVALCVDDLPGESLGEVGDGLAPIRQRLASCEPKRVCALPAEQPGAWLARLEAMPVGELQAVVAEGGVIAWDHAGLRRLCELVRSRLAPGGWLALALPNPENLLVLSELAAGDWPGIMMPVRAERLLCAAGFDDVTVIRWARPSTAHAQPEGNPDLSADDPLRRALQQPRRFLVVGVLPAVLAPADATA